MVLWGDPVIGQQCTNGSDNKISEDEVIKLLNSLQPRTIAPQANQSKVVLFPDHQPPLAIKTPSVDRRLSLLSRWLIRREYTFYKILQGVPGIPHCYGLFNGDQLVLEYQPGSRPRKKNTRSEAKAIYPCTAVGELRKTIAAMHYRGVAHADLKRTYNLIHSPDNRLVVIDFGTALLRRGHKGGPLWRWAAQQDWNAWVHYGWGKNPELMPPAVARLYRFTMLERIAKRLKRMFDLLRGKN